MKHLASQHLYAYWNTLRAGRAAPERSDIDPARIRSVLADTLMVEIEQGASSAAPRACTIRLSGTRVNALFAGEIKGRSLASLWRMEDRRELVTLVKAVLDDSRPMVAGMVAAPLGSAPLPVELLLLPLRHQGKTHARMLGVLSSTSAPAWLGLVPVAPLTLVSHRMIEPAAPERPVPPRNEGAVSRALGTKRGNFIIYEGGRRDAAEPEASKVRRS